ncbi:Transmembrane protein [Trema orientale]|uniref:Transmembrane protein n=1 Tax=Trema orientale TaxID=63057 RepID=A0A2P5ELW7_TREOI|nr:Transmembrane protein [Trema orientale]
MAKREFLKSVILVLLVLVALMSLECQKIVAAEARLSKGCVPNQRCHVEAQEPLDVKEDIDPGDHEAAPGNDDDFYRQYGDVPSPGIGH